MDPKVEFGETVMRPGLIWACTASAGGTAMVDGDEPPDDCAFRWLHLNLADQRTQRWLERSHLVPPAIERLFLSQEQHPRMAVEGGAICLVLYDFERDFDRLDTGRIGALHIAVGPGLILTGRYHPLHTADILRQRIAGGATVAGAEAGLELILDGLADTVATRVLDVSTELLAAEDDLLAGESAPDTRELVGVRRLCTQLARINAGTRAVIQRLAADPELPRTLRPAIERSGQRLASLDGDIAAAQAQLRLLRDELDLQAAQRTNRNLYVLSIMTALMMPATLVTGFFGMNTGGLPFEHPASGTLIAAVLAIASSLGTYLALRMMGFVRQ